MLTTKSGNQIRALLIAALISIAGLGYAETTASTTDTPIVDNLWMKIKEGQYTEVERTLQAAYERYRNNLEYEDDLFLMYEFTDILNPDDEAVILKWVSSDKESFNANLVLGLYYRSMGWKARGSKYTSLTPREKRMKMFEYYEKSFLSLQKAMAVNEAHPVPYRDVMKIFYGLGGQRSTGYNYFLQGLKHNEGSYTLRYTYVNYLQPKWGGTQAEFDQFSKDVEELYDRYTGLRKLVPLYYWYLADYYDGGRDSELAIKYYKKSIELDGSCHTHNDLGWLYQRMDQHKNAIKHTDITLSRCKDSDGVIVEALRIRARAQYDLGKKTEAFENFSRALERQPNNPVTLGSRGGIYYRDKQYIKALADLDRAISYRDPKIWMLTARARTYKKLNRLNESVNDYTAAIKLSPAGARNYERRGELYIKLELYEEAKNDVETVLKLQPDNKWALHYADWARQAH